MKSSTQTLIEAMQILAAEIKSEDGVANTAILEASERLKELEAANLGLTKTLLDCEHEGEVLSDLIRSESKRSEIRDLEQQAKALEDYAEQENKLKELYHFKDGEDIQHINLITGLNSRSKHLRKQAAKLNEQNND